MAAVNRMNAPAGLVNGAGLEEFEKDVEALIWDNQQQVERERELNIFRSGSAPPTVEGSRNAISSLFGGPGVAELNGYDSGTAMSEEEMRSHPAYLSYCYSNEKLNPRLPSPALSKEDWRAAQRFQVGASTFGRTGDRRREVVGVGVGDGSSGSLFSLHPGLHMRDVDGELAERRIGQRNSVRQAPAEWVERGSDGLLGFGSGTRRKSFADALQEEVGQSLSVSAYLSRPSSRNDFVNVNNPVGLSDIPWAQLQDSLKMADYLKSEASSASLMRVQNLGSSVSHSFASVLGSSLVKSTTPDPQIVGRSSSPSLPTLGGREDFPSNGTSTCLTVQNDIAAAFSGLNLMNNRLSNEDNDICGASLQEFADKTDNLFSVSNSHNNCLKQNVIKTEVDSSNIPSFPVSSKIIGLSETNTSKLTSDSQVDLPKHVTTGNACPKVPSGLVISNGFGNPQNPRIMSVDFAGNHASNSPLSQRPPTLRNSQIDTGGIVGQYLNNNGDHTVSGIQAPLVEPLFAQQLQRTHSFPDGAASLGRNLVGSSQMDMSAYQKAYLKALLAQHKLQYELPFLGKSGAFLSHGYYDTLASSLGLQYPINPIAGSILPSFGSLSPPRQGDKLSHFPSMMKSSAGASVGSWSSEYGVVEEGFALSLLEEFKSNKSRSFELSEIVGHVVEFSADQYGSRFIQQKLETASIEEKNKIFPEIFTHARALMTDVFGNYVIQKFLEHGSESQKKQLSSQLIGHVLPLSLQMYGCRVIQKALEVVDVDQQNQIVLELDGSIMKCVRDQNGNHVIQKCIECVPQERIQFIISAFYGQVVPLSTHPYGCRVIQRVLEHCDDAKTQSIMMDEILQAVCALAQDQYGNYVVQHVLQHGKPQERSAIIKKLAGQIVKMSQQKFASNVVEKCLTYGASEERQLLINEMLGSTDENEPLQAMMKDQFGNYVVQKALETCDDKNRELILSRIKAHVNALKRYTYGKHIAARVEKVIAAGERRISMSSCTP